MVSTREQLLDDSVNFSCTSCTACCDQPWRTVIDADRAHALDGHDWSAYPQLAGKALYSKATDNRQGYYDLPKAEGTRCLFLGSDNLCIIHKELGVEAKPHVCRQFPFLPAHTWTEDRVSVNYGCPAVHDGCDLSLAEQADEIAETVPLSNRPPNPEGPVVLDMNIKLTQAEGDALFDRALAIFADGRGGSVWARFGELLALLAAVKTYKSTSPDDADELIEQLVSGAELAGTPDVPRIMAWHDPALAPMPARFLFSATLYPDALPPDAAASMKFLKRLTLIPKLLALTTMTGVYPSRVLGRVVSVGKVMAYEVQPELTACAQQMLIRYFRSRLWQRLPAGTRLTVVAGVHQHIHDLYAIVFLAKAQAEHQGVTLLDEKLIRQALTHVEFHLANQKRLYEHTLKTWLKGRLGDLSLAFDSLKMMALERTPEPAAVD